MNLDEAIRYAEKTAERYTAEATCFDNEVCHIMKQSCLECAKDNRQLAEWLKELKERREGSTKKIGFWKRYYNNLVCSECGGWSLGYIGSPNHNYCPRCGAKMEGEEVYREVDDSVVYYGERRSDEADNDKPE